MDWSVQKKWLLRRTIYLIGQSPPYQIDGTADGLVCPEKAVTPPYHLFDRAEDQELFLFYGQGAIEKMVWRKTGKKNKP